MITRQAWRDAIRASGLPASRRAVLLDMADYWPTSTTMPILWRSQKDITRSTGYSESTIKRAWADAVRAGLLVPVEGPRQHHSPRWAPVLPPTQGGQDDRSDEPQGGHSDCPGAVDNSPRAVTLNARAVTVTPDSPNPPRTTTTSERDDAPAALGLALVVVDELPPDLAAAVGRPVLARALGPAAAAGWTPQQITAAARAHGWAGARGGGAVIAWAEDLATQPPPAPAAAPIPEQRCGTHDTTYRTVCAGCRADTLANPRAGTG